MTRETRHLGPVSRDIYFDKVSLAVIGRAAENIFIASSDTIYPALSDQGLLMAIG
jgi:hypothetical protein